jgi:ankyrin repeat protein
MQTMRNEIQEPGKVQVSHWFVHEEVLVTLTSTPSQHVKNHTKPQGCQHCDRRFATPSDLNRHVKARHRVKHELFHCSYPNCRFTTIRKDYLPQHLSIIHHLEPGIDQRKSLGEQKDEQDLLRLRRVHMFQLAESGNVEYMKTLLKAGAVLDIQGDDGSTLLHCSARAGQIEMVKYLLDQKVNTNQRNSKGGTPLHEAVVSGSQEMVELLLRHEADYTLADNRGKTATHYAVVAGRVDIVRSLLESYGSGRTTAMDRLLPSAIKAGQSSILVFFHSHPGFMCSRKTTLDVLRKACIRGLTWVVSQLLGLAKIDVNVRLRNFSLLQWASIYGHADVVSLLLAQKSIRVDDDILYRALPSSVYQTNRKGRMDVLKLLLQHPNTKLNHAVSNNRNNTTLHEAASKGLVEEVRILLDCKGIDINAENDRSETALHTARYQYQLRAEYIRRFKKEGGEWISTSTISLQNYEEIVNLLLAHGAVEIRKNSGILTSDFDHPTIIYSDVNDTSVNLSDLSDADEEVEMNYDGEANAITE